MIIPSFLKVGLNLETCVELLKLVIMNTIWYSNTITIQRPLLNGFISRFKMSKNLRLINSTSLIWSNQRALTTKEWNRCFIQKKKPIATMDKAMDGIEMAKISVTSRILWKRKVAVFITPWHSPFNSNMMIVISTWLIATLTLTQTAQNYFRDCVNQRVRIALEKPLYAKLLLETTVKWLLLLILVQDLKKLPLEEPLW